MNRLHSLITLPRTTLALVLMLAAGASAEPTAMTPIGPATPTAIKPETPTSGPLSVTVMDAILLALENNRALRVQRLEPALRRTFENQEDGAFDPVLTGGLSKYHTRTQEPANGGTGLTNADATAIAASTSLSKTFATGTKVSLEGTTRLDDSSSDADRFASTRAGLSITQSLLKGGRISANLASLRQARLDTLSTEYQLRGFAEALVARVESAYWNYALTQRQIDIYTESLALAEQQLAETQARIHVGKTAELDLSAAEAEVAARQTGLINARSALDKTRIQFQALLNSPGTKAFERNLVLLDPLTMPTNLPDNVSDHVTLAMRLRPDLNETRLAIQRGSLDVIKTRNGLLPRLDLFVSLGSSGYADSFQPSARRVDGDFHDTTAGLEFAIPLGNKTARAQHQRATLSRDQAAEALANMQQLAEMDVRLAYVEIGRAREEAAATSVLVKRREETARAEAEKFRVGKSTTLQVAQTQRDLLVSQIQQVEATINYLKSFVALYRNEGSLLERRGISAPGREPVTSNP